MADAVASIEQALLARARPQVLLARAEAFLLEEVAKGCSGEIAPFPMPLEPTYQPMVRGGASALVPQQPTLDQESTSEQEFVRLVVWVSAQQECDWLRAELFLKELSHLPRTFGLEITGNADGMSLRLLCGEEDVQLLRAAFLAQFEQCELSLLDPATDVFNTLLNDDDSHLVFRDYYPQPPYSHLLTRPDELVKSPYSALASALAEMPTESAASYQVLFRPVSPEHNWHRNVELISDLEFSTGLLHGILGPYRYAQQLPSGDLRRMAADVATKAHPDKPFFCAALRIVVIGKQPCSLDLLAMLAAGPALLQHGGRPLNWLTHEDYAVSEAAGLVRRILHEGFVCRPGFLVNSLELASLVHIPQPATFEARISVAALEALPPDAYLRSGTPIGYCHYAGACLPVCIPPDLRLKHVHIIGRSGTGKSSMMERMILADIAEGCGVAVLDPHGRLVRRLLGLIPEACADRVIYFNPGDLDWVPIWNPLRTAGRMDPGRVADELVGAFKSFVTGWGDRLEHLLRHALFGLLHVEGACLLDVANLLRRKSRESRLLRPQVIRNLRSEAARQFWMSDFDRYSNADLSPAQHKLSKLLMSGSVSLMLSQSDTSFDLFDVMNSCKVLLVDLSGIGPEVRDILGCFILSLLHLNAIRRSSAEDAAPFHVYCDEAHHFVTDAIEDLIAETRKFNVSLTLAHQYLRQFALQKCDALTTGGSTVLFRLDMHDAQYLQKDLQSLVEAEELTVLGIGQAVARLGDRVVRLETPPPAAVPEGNPAERIIAASHARYYRPADEVRQAIRSRSVGTSRRPAHRRTAPAHEYPPDAPARKDGDEEFFYDEF